MKRRLFLPLAVLLLLLAIGLLCYPACQTRQAQKRERAEIADFAAYLQQTDCDGQAANAPTADENTTQKPAQGMPFAALLTACQAYNAQLYMEHQCRMDAQTMRQAPLDLGAYGYTQEVFCVLSCPTVGLEIPVYLGASDTNLDKGAAVLGQTSLPIGGASTHCVVAGHRSWNAAIRFRDIEALTVGDLVRLTNPWETLTYRVVSIQTVAASAIDPIKIHPNQDLLTLLTCAAPNTSRYLVMCERVRSSGNNKEISFSD